MNQTLIHLWNTIACGNTVLILGNFGIGSVAELSSIVKQFTFPAVLSPGAFDKPSVFHTGIERCYALTGSQGLKWHDYYCGGLGAQSRPEARAALSKLSFLPITSRGAFLVRSDKDAKRIIKLKNSLSWVSYVGAFLDIRITSDPAWHTKKHEAIKLNNINCDLNPIPTNIRNMAKRAKACVVDVKKAQCPDSVIFVPQTGYLFRCAPEESGRLMYPSWRKETPHQPDGEAVPKTLETEPVNPPIPLRLIDVSWVPASYLIEPTVPPTTHVEDSSTQALTFSTFTRYIRRNDDNWTTGL